MSEFFTRISRRVGAARPIWLLAPALFFALSHAAFATENIAEKAFEPDGPSNALVVPLVDPARGRVLFVNKGCVLCHQVNGVGGKAAPALDAPEGEAHQIDPFAFMARMWRGAKAMIALQDKELGYQIALDGDEIAALTGFAYDIRQQRKLTIDQVPKDIREAFIDEPFDGWVGLQRNPSEPQLAER